MKICIFGAASKTIDEKYIVPVEELGRKLAERGHSLVFGAGCTGEMGAAARGFKSAGGTIHGVVPEFFKQDLHDFVNWECDEMTITDSMRERKAVMEDLADAFVVVPGGAGTFEELFEVFTLKQLGQHRKPIALLNIDGYYDKMQDLIDFSISEEFIKTACRGLYIVTDNTDELIDYVENDTMHGITIDDMK